MMNPFKLGIKHFWNGKMGGNPYEVNTEDHRNYEFGFNKAYFKNLRAVEASERAGRQTEGIN